MNLTLSLERKWYDMSTREIEPKTEDYRAITPYWCKRILEKNEGTVFVIWELLIKELSNSYNVYTKYEEPNECVSYFGLKFKTFTTTTITLGYPAKDDWTRKSMFENLGIEIGYGKPEWGAPENELVFIIKHGRRLK